MREFHRVCTRCMQYILLSSSAVHGVLASGAIRTEPAKSAKVGQWLTRHRHVCMALLTKFVMLHGDRPSHDRKFLSKRIVYLCITQ